MMRSMFSGVSGLRIHQTKMDVIANNISNVNTVGFKSSRVTFRDAFYQRIQGASGENPITGRTGTNPMQIGLGANVASIDSVMTQGLSQRTDVATDTMIQGEGFFIVNDTSGTFFTRAGKIDRDAAWNLNINGMALMGWDTVEDEVTGELVIQKGPVEPIKLGGDKQNVPPSATTMIDIIGNLNVTELPQKKDATGKTYVETTTTLDFYDSIGNNYKTNVKLKYYSFDPADGINNTQNHVDGVWTFEFENFEGGFADDANAASGVVVYPGGDKTKPKQVAIHVGGTDSYNGDDASGIWSEEFSPKGMLIFDTEGQLVGWDTLNINVTNDDTEDPPISAPQPSRQDVIQHVRDLGLVYDAGTNSVVGIQDLIDAGAVPADLTLTAPADGWRTLEGVSDQRMNIIIAPIDVLDPTSTLGELTNEITIEHDGEGATIGIPGDTAGTTVSNNADLVVQAGTMTIDFSQLTQHGGRTTELKPNRVNGNKPGTLEDLSIDASGKIYGRYTNGEQKLLGQIAVAKFENPAGLDRVGNNLFAATVNSGQFNGTGSEGNIMSGALEMSNVDLSQEFTEMITTQRGFQANSRVITVSDEMLQELVNLKR